MTVRGASEAGAQHASQELVRCAQPLGTAALVEPLVRNVFARSNGGILDHRAAFIIEVTLLATSSCRIHGRKKLDLSQNIGEPERLLSLWKGVQR